MQNTYFISNLSLHRPSVPVTRLTQGFGFLFWVFGFFFFNLIHKFGIYIGNTEETLAFSAINSNEVKLMTRDRSLLKRNKDTGYTNKCISLVEEEYD